MSARSIVLDASTQISVVDASTQITAQAGQPFLLALVDNMSVKKPVEDLTQVSESAKTNSMIVKIMTVVFTVFTAVLSVLTPIVALVNFPYWAVQYAAFPISAVIFPILAIGNLLVSNYMESKAESEIEKSWISTIAMIISMVLMLIGAFVGYTTSTW